MHIKIKRQHKIIWNDPEKKTWEPPREIEVSQWADDFRILLPMTSAEPGKWRTARTPYLKGMMDAFNDPLVEEITVMASTQIGKTEGMYNMLGYAIDQDPGPALLVMPREADAKSVSHNRIKPMLESSPALKKHLPHLSDDITKLEYHLDHMIVYFSGSNSPADLAQRPIRYLFLDEVDKFPKFSGREADPIKLATERTRTFWNRKIVKVSTPTIRQGYIFREYEKSDQRRFYLPCPHCGGYQVLVFGQIKWPENERSSERIKNERLAWYECSLCNKRIEDYQKNKILLNGRWMPSGAGIDEDGTITGDYIKSKHRGFWINSLYSPWLSWSDIAAEFLKSKDYIELLMNFVNSWLAEPWEEKTEESKPEKIATLALGYAKGIVPTGVKILTAGVDVQKDHFYFIIRGWGIGEESWLIREDRVESWQDIIDALFITKYPSEHPGIEPFGVRLSCVDSGYRTDEVYAVCRKWRDIARPTKGKDFLTGVPFQLSHIDRHPNTGKPIPGGLTLWHLDTNHFKDKVNRLVHTEPGSPGEWHLHSHMSETYLKQFCAEHKIIIRDRKTGRATEKWVAISQGAQTHYWDCEVYATAAAEMMRVSMLREVDEDIVYKPGRLEPRKKWLDARGQWTHKGKTSWIGR